MKRLVWRLEKILSLRQRERESGRWSEMLAQWGLLKEERKR